MNLQFFIPGCIGAIAPEIIRFYQLRLQNNHIKLSKFYYIISVFYIILGGYIASIFPGLKGPFWAMCIGVGLVTTINAMAKIAETLNAQINAKLNKPKENTNPNNSQGKKNNNHRMKNNITYEVKKSSFRYYTDGL